MPWLVGLDNSHLHPAPGKVKSNGSPNDSATNHNCGLKCFQQNSLNILGSAVQKSDETIV